MAKHTPYPIIFTDLDGTLLDHHSYSASPADQLVHNLHNRAIASVIPITSKTYSELRNLKSLPFNAGVGVTENGSVIRAPSSLTDSRTEQASPIMLGVGYQEILTEIAAIPPDLRTHINGFHDMSAANVVDATGLTIDHAVRAKEREATEPFLWSGSDAQMEALRAILADSNLQIQQGGRFYHFTGAATKQQAMTHVTEIFAAQAIEKDIVSIALGDGPNDLAMIEAADFGVIMPNPDGVTIRSDKSHVRTAPLPGPNGWIRAVGEILDLLGFHLNEN